MAPFERTTLLAHLKHAGGRPSDYKPEYSEQVIEAARAQGLSLTAFAGLIGVSRDTVYEWIKRHSEFSDACSRAKSARVLWWELKLGRSRKGAETTASIFALRNAAPDEWRDVRYQEHKHSVGIDRLTRDQLNAIASGIEPADAGVIDGECTRLDDELQQRNER
jgi:transposase